MTDVYQSLLDSILTSGVTERGAETLGTKIGPRQTAAELRRFGKSG